MIIRSLVTLFMLTLIHATADARITRLEITSVTPDQLDPSYTRYFGRAFGEVDPKLRQNRIIQDIELAPTNGSGAVEYSMDFTIVAPPNGGNGLLFYEAPNVGFALTELDNNGLGALYLPLGKLARHRGYTLVYSGWQQNLIPIAPPFAQHMLTGPTISDNGATVAGRVRAAYISEVPTSTMLLAGRTIVPQTAPTPVDLNQADAVLTRRPSRNEPEELVDRSRWAFADCSETPFPGTPSPQHLCLAAGFDPEFVYELIYTAQDPKVGGLGFAATRDLMAFLRHQRHDDQGTENPVAGSIKKSILFGVSLSSAYARQFLHLGFNRDEAGRIVFDGTNPHTAPTRLALNTRFNMPVGIPSQRQNFKPGVQFPFSVRSPSFDPLTRRKGWILARCLRTRTCPKIMETLTGTEYWQFVGSLSTTDPMGRRDLPEFRNTRSYFLSSGAHIIARLPSVPECQQLLNSNDYRSNHKALIVALERWVLDGVEPPKSRVPKIRNRTLVAADRVRWPEIPGVSFAGVFNDLPLVDYGPQFRHRDISGVRREPPVVVTPPRLNGYGKIRFPRSGSYGVLLPQVDEDGNDMAGIRSVAIQAPVGTYTGWSIRSEGFGEGNLCFLNGSFIPFAVTEKERRASGDPRLSLEERYGSHDGYVKAVSKAAKRLLRQSLLLPEDADRLIQEARDSDILL